MAVGRARLHPSGPDVSELVWGLWRVVGGAETGTPRALADMIAACIDLGITTFDTADIYGGYAAEALQGEAMRVWGGDRRTIEIVTKCDIKLVGPARPEHRVKHYDTSGAHIRTSVERSLANLQTDYVDLLLLHRPDPLMDADETADALMRLIEAGLVRHVGVSNHGPAEIDLLQSRLPVPLVTNQIEFSVACTTPLHDDTLLQAQRLRMRPMLWSPLGGGDLFAASQPRAREIMTALDAVGAEHGVDDASVVAIAWLMRHPSRPVPVLGTGRASRLTSLARAASLRLDRQQWFRILEAAEGREVP